MCSSRKLDLRLNIVFYSGMFPCFLQSLAFFLFFR